MRQAMAEHEGAASSRKRQRSEDILASSLTSRSVALRTSQEVTTAPTRASTDFPVGTLSMSNEGHTTSLAPLRPPISTVSHGRMRKSSAPQGEAEGIGDTGYNIALPLPNPGRAHRFCQNCEQVNHVRRKVCTNCGTPKPSALRSAVGVSRVAPIEGISSQKQAGDSAGTGAGTNRTQSPMFLGSQLASPGIGSRFLPQSAPTTSMNLQSSNLSPTFGHSRSITPRNSVDDVSYGVTNWQKHSAPALALAQLHQERRLRPAQVLSEPLLNMNTFQPQSQGLPPSHTPPNTEDTLGKQAGVRALPREPHGLPSLFGIGQAPGHTIGTSSSTIPATSHLSQANSPEESLAEEVVAPNRSVISPITDSRLETRRHLHMNGFKDFKKDGKDFAIMYGTTNGHPSSLLSTQNTDLYQQPRQYLAVERLNDHRHETGSHTDLLYGTANAVQSYPRAIYSQQMTNCVPSALHLRGTGVAPNGLAHRPTNIHSQPLGGQQYQRSDDQVAHGTFEDANRGQDDGRLAIDSILMPHRAGEQNGHL